MDLDPKTQPKRRRWGWWAFLLLNLGGLILIVPLLRVTWPLVEVWWRTRSPESARTYRAAFPAPVHSADERREPVSAPTNEPLQALTNRLGLLEQLSDGDLRDIVGKNFGVSNRTQNGSAMFDMDSAVFDSITRTSITYQGQSYYGYLVNLVDHHGNHQTNLDCFAEPNPDYERSLAALELIGRSPQLRRIYQAMAPGLAERAASSQSEGSTTTNPPVLRLNPDSIPK